jgi:hypothetical protein
MTTSSEIDALGERVVGREQRAGCESTIAGHARPCRASAVDVLQFLVEDRDVCSPMDMSSLGAKMSRWPALHT